MLKAAVEIGHPPTAVLLNDPSRKEWTAFDYKLIKAYHLRQTYGDVPPWIDRSERVSWNVKTFTSRSGAAIEKKQEADGNKKNTKFYGRRYYAVPEVVDGGPMPTMAEYYEEQKRLNNR